VTESALARAPQQIRTASALVTWEKVGPQCLFPVWRFLRTKLRSIPQVVKIHLVTGFAALVTVQTLAGNVTTVHLAPFQQHAAMRRNDRFHSGCAA
jgi:hypothetical protein